LNGLYTKFKAILHGKKKKKEKCTQAVKATPPHINQGKEATLVPSAVKLLHREKERKSMGIRRVAGLA